MKRTITTKLIEWKNRSKRKPLLIKGARQVGKTYIIRAFAKAYYEDYIEINFEKNEEYKQIFEKTKNPQDIFNYLQLSFMDKKLNSEALLFLDEIQACSSAITALKFLSEEFPCDIICSGSNLGIAIATTSSFPVGYVEIWDMYPLSFLEFIQALEINEDIINNLKDCLIKHQPISEIIHDKFNELFKIYMIVGGMPEVVSKYIETKSFVDVLNIQRQIVNTYLNDIAKYANGADRIKARECYQTIPLQLAKENKKFQYKLVKKGGNARHYDSSLNWLKDSGLIIPVHRLDSIQKPLEAYKDLATFKVYMSDTGLLISQLNESVIKELLNGDLGVFKGALYENITAQILHSYQKESYYFEPSQTSEIDFVTYYHGEITPLEIKSSKNTVSKSFRNFIEKYTPKHAFRLSQKNIGQEVQEIESVPLYLLELLLEEDQQFLENSISQLTLNINF